METETKVINCYDVSLKWDMEYNAAVLRSGSRSPLVAGPPPEYLGNESVWTPEHLLVSSLAACYTSIFMHFARMLRAPVRSMHVEAKVEFEKEGNGPFEGKHFILHPIIEFAHNPGEHVIENLLAKAKKYCLIGNSLKGDLIIEPSIKLD